jgi:hypothetical protein
MFENKVLTRMFRPDWVEIIGGWGTFHDEEFYDL